MLILGGMEDGKWGLPSTQRMEWNGAAFISTERGPEEQTEQLQESSTLGKAKPAQSTAAPGEQHVGKGKTSPKHSSSRQQPPVGVQEGQARCQALYKPCGSGLRLPAQQDPSEKGRQRARS